MKMMMKDESEMQPETEEKLVEGVEEKLVEGIWEMLVETTGRTRHSRRRLQRALPLISVEKKKEIEIFHVFFRVTFRGVPKTKDLLLGRIQTQQNSSCKMRASPRHSALSLEYWRHVYLILTFFKVKDKKD